MWGLGSRKDKKKASARRSQTLYHKGTSQDTSAGAESSQQSTPSPLPSPASVGSALSPKSAEDGRRASEPATIEPLPSPVHTGIVRAGSTFNVAVRSRSRSSNRANDPLGLTVVHQPETSPSLDIIFVHGLGGTSRATWSKGRDPDYFWPERWLPAEPAIRHARILSFGYNASFAQTGPTPITGIVDFAKDLLYAMKFAKDGELNELELGNRPIIFIVHSMGGLVVKQAYILGQNDEHYSEIISSVSAILFLATPHRGSDLAEILNRILTVSIFNHSSKQYVSELKQGSPTIQALNEQFRNIAPKLDILSFYETLKTTVGPKQMMVVERSSAILGYPKEISKSLDADHHTVCKYDSIYDQNYVSIRNALKTLVTAIRSKGQYMVASHSDPEIVELEGLLAVSEDYQEDLEFFRKRWTQGTCEWILGHPSFTEWIDESQGTMILWLNALPASGKSVLSSYIISHLLKENLCTFYFFRFGDQVKRSISTCLRTMIFQLADHLPRFRTELRAMRFPAKTLEKLDAKTLWEKVFVGVLFKMRLATTMYWVIDALDESDSSQALVELMQGLAKSTSPIKVLLVSRKTPELVQTFDRLQKVSVRVKDLPVEDTKKDIRTYVETEVQYMHAPDDFKAQIVERLVYGAAGNFLWARLAAIEVMKCNTEEDLDETLEGIPSGMENLYQRMEQTIIKTNRPRDHRLGQMILTWAACSRRPLLLKELIQALQPEFPVVMDLSHIINRVCGHFVAVDATNRLVMVHQTARDHITTTKSALGVKVADAHEKLFLKCVTVLEEKCSRRHPDRRNGNSKTPDYQEFLRYAMTSWNYHLNLTSSESDDPLVLLTKFLKGHSVLAWIEYLASNNILKVLVYSSKAMTTYARRKRSRYAGTNPLQHRLQELDLVESWAVDLLKIIGKFGPNIVADPKAIYNQVPPFCPKNSATYRHFEQSAVQPRLLTVKGISNVEWDDSLAKLDLGGGTQALIVAASGDHIAAATNSGDVFLYNATTFELKRVLEHKELISTIGFSHCTKKLVTYGSRTTKIWSVSTGSIVHEIPNPKGSRAFTIVFANGDSELVTGSADRRIRVADLTMPCPAWVILHPSLLEDETILDRPVHKSPWKMAFNSDASYIAVAYRNFPLCVWSLDLDRPELINRCMRNKQYAGNSWTVVDQIIWHSDSDELIGLYMGGHVFRWNPHTNEQQELQAEASILASSPDGKFFAVGDSNGSIKLYDFQHFALVYQLSFDSMICDICFSPDGKRLYDVRGQYCNVWEPNALIRAEVNGEQDSEDRSDVASIPTLAVSETFAEVRDQVTAVAIQFQGRYQAIANEAGVVMIIDTSSDEYRAVQIWRASIPLSIANLAWSDDGNFLACSELTGRVVVKRVQRINQETWRVKPTFDVKVTINGDGIQQILLNDVGTLLLVKNGSATTVWSLDERTSSGTWKVSISSPETKWTKHPIDKRLLLAFNCTHVRIHQWADLTEVAAFTLTTDIPQPLTPITGNSQVFESRFFDLRIQSIHLNPSGTQCLLDFVQPTATGDQHSLTLFEVPRSSTRTLTSERIPAEVLAQIEMPLGFLPNQRLVFLDKSYWMCTLRLDAGSSVESIQRHYFLPKDWLNARCLQHCAVLHDGKVLVPNNGDLAVIACLDMGG